MELIKWNTHIKKRNATHQKEHSSKGTLIKRNTHQKEHSSKGTHQKEYSYFQKQLSSKGTLKAQLLV